MTAGPAVVLSGVAKSFTEGGQRRRVLDGITATVAAGTWTVLLGRSGSGKSTLLNLMSGMDVADAGTIRVAGEDVHAMDEAGRSRLRRTVVGVVFQHLNLIPTLTVGENLLLRIELAGRRDDAAARTLLAEVGLADRWDAWPDRLSGGEQQRCAVAAALAHGPSVVLADEPTGSLDAATGAVVLDLLERLTRRAGRTLIMATHDAAIAERADAVWRMQDGRLG
jgi:putative ABC transport system ATP-binding protein